jgi:SAM-dependent methyltransferase
MHRKYASLKTGLFRKAPSVIVELGPAVGANLRYMPRGTTLIAIEPNKHMHPLLQRRADQFGIDLDLRGVAGEQLVPSESVDFVFSSLVLCTVGQPSQVISEVRRVLKPGGRFACVEHIEAPPATAIMRLQHVIRGPWKWLFEGCDLCRDTGATLRSSGYADRAMNISVR